MAAIIDLAALLYLNPELAATGAATTHAEAAALWDTDAAVRTLPTTMPPVPPGFDPRVYLASQPSGASALNDTIKAAMVASGRGDIDGDAVERRGVFVATVMQEVLLQELTPGSSSSRASAASAASASFRLEYAGPSLGYEFSDDVLRVGDVLRLQRTLGRGAASTLEGRVASVDADRHGFRVDLVGPNGGGPALAADASGAGGQAPMRFTAFGIKVWDAERQARVAYARELQLAATGVASSYPFAATVASNTPTDDIVPRGDFDVRVYRNLYPEAASHSFSDAYIDYRSRWKRGNDFRIKKAADIFNLQAPYAADLLGGGAGAGAGYIPSGSDVYVRGVLYAGSLTATPSFVKVNGTAILGSTCNAPAGTGFLVVTSNAMWAGSNATRAPLVSLTTNTFDVLNGAVFAGSNAVSLLRDGATSAVTVTRTSVDILGGTVAVQGNATVFSGVVGIGMACTGTEGVSALDPESGWEDDSALGGAALTRLAVDGNIYATGTLITLSDPRAKRDIRAIDDALGRLSRINGYTYRMREPAGAAAGARSPGSGGSRRRHVGLLATEVAAAMPEAVYDVPGGVRRRGTTSDDGDDRDDGPTMSSVAYGNLVGLLASAVNQLHERVISIERHLRSSGAPDFMASD